MPTERLSADDPAVQQALGRKRHKYNATRTDVDGIMFASMKEALRYAYLREMAREGLIRGLALQPSFDLHVAGVQVGRFVADFQYIDSENGEVIVEDSKGFRTPLYRLKRKMFEAEYGMTLREV